MNIDELENERLWVCHPDEGESHIIQYEGYGCPEHPIAGGSTLPMKAVQELIQEQIRLARESGIEFERGRFMKAMHNKGVLNDKGEELYQRDFAQLKTPQDDAIKANANARKEYLK